MRSRSSCALLFLLCVALLSPVPLSAGPIPPPADPPQPLAPPYTSFVNVSDQANVVDTLPSIAVDPLGHVHVAWMGTHLSPGAPNGVATDVYYSQWEGVAFSLPISIPVATGYYSKDISIAADAQGYAHVAFRRSEDQVWDLLDDDIFYATNRSGSFAPGLAVDGGSSGGPAAAGPRRPSLALDGAGAAHIVFLGSAGTEIFYTSNATGSFGPPVAVPGGDSWSVDPPRAVVDRFGTLHIAFKGDSADTWGDILYTNNAGGTFGSPVNVSEPGIEYDTSLVVDDSGAAHIVYDRMDSPKICYVTNRSGTFGPPACFGYGGKPNVALDGRGYVHVAYVSGDVMAANNAAGEFEPFLLADLGVLTNTGQGDRWFAVGSDDRLHLVFHAGFHDPMESFEIYALGAPLSELVSVKVFLPLVVR